MQVTKLQSLGHGPHGRLKTSRLLQIQASYMHDNFFDELLEQRDFSLIMEAVGENAQYLDGDNRNGTKIPIVYVAEQFDLELVRLLIELGADVNAADCRGQTAPHRASIGDSLEVAACLIDNRADLELIDRSGYTPLMWASCGGDKRLLSFYESQARNTT